MVLNSRFRLLAEAIVSGGVFVLSILLNLLLSPAFNDATGQFGNGMNVLLLLVAAVFLYTNNLAQKLSLSLLMICNYAFLLPVTTTLLKALPFAGDGIWSAVIGSLLYIVLTFLSFRTLAHPFRYLHSAAFRCCLWGFVRRLLSVYSAQTEFCRRFSG